MNHLKTALLALLLISPLFAKSLDSNYSIAAPKTTATSFLALVETKTGYSFSYDNAILDTVTTAAVDADNKSLRSILTTALGTSFTFTPLGKHIVIMKREGIPIKPTPKPAPKRTTKPKPLPAVTTAPTPTPAPVPKATEATPAVTPDPAPKASAPQPQEQAEPVVSTEEPVTPKLQTAPVVAPTATKSTKMRYFVAYNSAPDNSTIPLIGFVNRARGTHSSAQVGFVNNTAGVQWGAQVGFVNGVGDDLYGAQVGFINPVAAKADGAQIGFVNSVGESLVGAQVGFVNGMGTSLLGGQLGFVNHVGDNAKAVQYSFVNTVGDSLTGAQFGLVNSARNHTYGAQIGIVNKTSKLTGLQLGLINVIDSASKKSVPIGFLSFVKHGGYKAIELSSDHLYPVNLALKTGLRHLYSTILVSGSSRSEHTIGIGAGLGSLLGTERVAFNPEVQTIISFPGSPDFAGKGENYWNTAQRFTTYTGNVVVKISPRFSAVAGLKVGTNVKPKKRNEFHKSIYSLINHEYIDQENNNLTNLTMGFNLGVRWEL